MEVVWIELAKAYCSLFQEMTQMSLEAYHVPENIRKMMDIYFWGLTMHLLTKEYKQVG